MIAFIKNMHIDRKNKTKQGEKDINIWVISVWYFWQ